MKEQIPYIDLIKNGYIKVIQDKDGWFRVARNGRVIKGWDDDANLYPTEQLAYLAMFQKYLKMLCSVRGGVAYVEESHGFFIDIVDFDVEDCNEKELCKCKIFGDDTDLHEHRG